MRLLRLLRATPPAILSNSPNGWPIDLYSAADPVAEMMASIPILPGDQTGKVQELGKSKLRRGNKPRSICALCWPFAVDDSTVMLLPGLSLATRKWSHLRSLCATAVGAEVTVCVGLGVGEVAVAALTDGGLSGGALVVMPPLDFT